jgi:hypothetical protein
MSKSNIAAAFVMLGVALSSGCASGGGSGSQDDSITGSVEVTIWNRSDRTLMAYARWGNAPRVRLGQLSGTRRGTYTTPVRGPTMAISWDIVSGSPPPATAGAGAPFPVVADGTGNPVCPVSVQAGDRVEWTIDNTGRGCTYVRLDPNE